MAERERVVMTRMVCGRAPGRELDIAFWQKLGPSRIFEAAWDLVVTPPPREAFMKINSDSRDLLRSFNADGVRYLIVGVRGNDHTEPRYTKDLDLDRSS